MDPTYKRSRASPSLEGSVEYLRLVHRFALLQGLCLPSSTPALNADMMPTDDAEFHSLTDDQTLFHAALQTMRDSNTTVHGSLFISSQLALPEDRPMVPISRSLFPGSH